MRVEPRSAGGAWDWSASQDLHGLSSVQPVAVVVKRIDNGVPAPPQAAHGRQSEICVHGIVDWQAASYRWKSVSDIYATGGASQALKSGILH